LKEETEYETFLRICHEDAPEYDKPEDTPGYKTLLRILNMSPEPIRIPMDEIAKKARKFENEGEFKKAYENFHRAGQLAIYHKNMELVREYFGKEIELRTKMNVEISESLHLIIQVGITEEALETAKKYYQERERIESLSKRY